MTVSALEAIIFDFDGVIVESVSVKGEAFVALYANESKEIREKVLSYHTENGGISRFDKIRYYETELCGREIDESGVNELAEKFSEIVEDMVIQSEWVTGALEFLQEHHGKVPFYIASATPQAELERIVTKRGIAGFFEGVFGSPKKKDVHLEDIIEANGYAAENVVMIGDAITDYNAAKSNNTHFIGRRLCERASPFPERTVMIDDLSTLAEQLKL